MIPNRTWRQFVNAPENKNLSLSEQKRKYSDERKRFEQQNQFINSGLFVQGLKNG
jgi:hypothetical protein|tara:strand:- start:545 stop:709 length:165 start_codon:yes stop_codon:yes gene_type:complete